MWIIRVLGVLGQNASGGFGPILLDGVEGDMGDALHHDEADFAIVDEPK